MVYYGERPNKAVVRQRVMNTLAELASENSSECVQYVSLAGFEAIDSRAALASGISEVVAVEEDASRYLRLKINVRNTAIKTFKGTLGEWAGSSVRPSSMVRFVWADFEGGFNQRELDQVSRLFTAGTLRGGDVLVITFDRSPRVMKLERPFKGIMDSAAIRGSAMVEGVDQQDIFAESLIHRAASKAGLGIRSLWRIRYTDSGRTIMVTAALEVLPHRQDWFPGLTEVLPKPTKARLIKHTLTLAEKAYLLHRMKAPDFGGARYEAVVAGLEDEIPLVTAWIDELRNMNPAQQAWVTIRFRYLGWHPRQKAIQKAG